jgi:DNA adenine methylase
MGTLVAREIKSSQKVELFGTRAKPFLKWAGGKSQLLPTIQKLLPPEIERGKIKRYVEPFLGGGAVFFWMTQFQEIEEFVISDVSNELYIVYQTLRENVEDLIERLSQLRKIFLSLSEEEQERFFYQQRELFNENQKDVKFRKFQASWVNRTAQFIFLNHTCFNGLYRTNSQLKFNVPFGKYKKPGIFDVDNLRAVSQILQNTTILHGDFESCEKLIDEETFIYFDPPYRPISKTSSFNTYHKSEFTDADQIRLADFFKRLDQKGAKLMLSNSDPKNEKTGDEFFDELYQNFRITRVKASRAINCNGAKRGRISELIITNY